MSKPTYTDDDLEAATADGIATGLSRALVALEERTKQLVHEVGSSRHDEAIHCARLVRELLESAVD